MNLPSHSSLLVLLTVVVIVNGCASRPFGDTSPELGRITEPSGDVLRYTVREGGRIEKARMTAEPDAYLGALLRPAPRGRLGARVDDLMHGGAAEAAGLEIGDVILAFGGDPVRSPAGLRAAVIEVPLGVKVSVRYRRRDEVREGEVVFLSRKEAVAEREYLPDLKHHRDTRLSGIEVVTVPPELAARLLGATDRRVVVTAVVVGSPGYHAGIRPGDRLLAADGRPLATTADFVAALAEREPGDRIVFVVEQDEQSFETRVRLTDLDQTTYWDLPVLFHHVANANATSTHLGAIVYSRESRSLPTTRREGARNLDVSFLVGLIKWEERRRGSGLRLFWVLPIGW